MEAQHPPMDRHILPAHPDIAAFNLSVFDEPRGNVLRGSDTEGKAQTLRRQDHSSIDADDLSSRIHQWPSRIAWIQSGIRLDHVIHEPPRFRAQRTAQRTD